MRINQNIQAFNAYRNLGITNNMLGKSLEKLSSGFRINRAADDASGLVISEALRSQVSGLRQATRNAQDGVSVVQTAEGALTEVSTMLGRIRDLIVQSANTASSDATARSAAQAEIVALRSEIDRIGNTTSFGSQTLLNGGFGFQSARITTNAAVAAAGLTVGATASTSFTIVLDSGLATSVSLLVELISSTYVTAQSFETMLQAQISLVLTSAAVQVNVVDLGNGTWSTEILRLSSATGSKVQLQSIGLGLGNQITSISAVLTNPTGGLFQVGANVTTANQIKVSVGDIRITGGAVLDFSALSSIDVTITTQHVNQQTKIDGAIAAIGAQRGLLGASQNRFEASVNNLQVVTENLAASESRIRDTDMALEMVSFTRHQIMQQAGTAMLAQANTTPQNVLRLLQ